MPLLLVLVRDGQDREVLSIPLISNAELTLRLLYHFQQWRIQVRQKLPVTFREMADFVGVIHLVSVRRRNTKERYTEVPRRYVTVVVSMCRRLLHDTST